jgi:hypothetical protein
VLELEDAAIAGVVAVLGAAGFFESVHAVVNAIVPNSRVHPIHFALAIYSRSLQVEQLRSGVVWSEVDPCLHHGSASLGLLS